MDTQNQDTKQMRNPTVSKRTFWKWIFNGEPPKPKSNEWLGDGRKVITENMRFQLIPRYPNYRLTKTEATFLHEIIKEMTEDKKEFDSD